MKNKKKIIFVVIAFVVAILLIIGGVLILKKNKEKNNVQSNQNINVIKSIVYDDYKYLRDANGLYIIENNDSVKFLNKQGEVVLEFNDLEAGIKERLNVSHNEAATLVNIDDSYRIYDKNYNLIIESKQELSLLFDCVTKISYYIKGDNLYNIDNELIYENLFKNMESHYLEIYGDYIINGIQLINIKTKEKYNYKFETIWGDKAIFFTQDIEVNKGKVVYIIDISDNTFEKYDYNEILSYGVLVYNDDGDKKLITNDQVINYGDNLEVKDYKFDYKACDKGFKVYNKNGELIEDTCYSDYYIFDGEDYIFLSKEDDNTELAYQPNNYLINDKIYEYMPMGKYFLDTSTQAEIKVYNENGEKVEHSCSLYISYYQDNMYVCSNGAFSYLMDESFNKISDTYERLQCEAGKCTISKDGKQGLIINNEVILDPSYENISLPDENIVIVDETFGCKFLILGEGEALSKEELNKEIELNINVDINSIIIDNELDDILRLINDNSELFKKYAYFVEKNKQLGKYKKYVYDSFPVVVKNKEYLDESYFFPALRNLYIVDKSDEKNKPANGYYYDGMLKIEILENWDSVIYHELMHFIDFRINQDDPLTIYSYEDKYLDVNEYNELSLEEQNKAEFLGALNANFLTEGGAEINTAMYLDNNIVTTYSTQITVYSILSYLYGNDFMNEVYFSKNGELKLFNKFLEAGYGYKEYNDFTSKSSIYYDNITGKSTIEFYDILIELYETQNSDKWYEDKVMSALVKNGLGYYEIKPSYTTRYNEYKSIKFDFEDIRNQFEEEYGDKYYINIYPSFMIYNNDIYVTFSVYGNIPDVINEKRRYFVAKYDVNTGKVVDYKYAEV